MLNNRTIRTASQQQERAYNDSHIDGKSAYRLSGGVSVDGISAAGQAVWILESRRRDRFMINQRIANPATSRFARRQALHTEVSSTTLLPQCPGRTYYSRGCRTGQQQSQKWNRLGKPRVISGNKLTIRSLRGPLPTRHPYH